MLRIKALFFLLLFFYSTVGTFASVHSCDGEITDLSILSVADCSHNEETTAKKECCHSCCAPEKKDDKDNDCCETDQLVVVDNLHFSPISVELITATDFLAFFNEFFEESKVIVSEERKAIFVLPPLIQEDIPILLHRLII